MKKQDDFWWFDSFSLSVEKYIRVNINCISLHCRLNYFAFDKMDYILDRLIFT